MVLPKKDSNEVRIVLDLRKINKQIVNEQYPLMRIEDILENLGGARVFSSLDLNNGYFNVKLSEEAQKKFAFSVPFAKYTFTRLCQGCLTSAAVFQRIMIDCLHDVILKGHVFVYLDDIIIHSPTIEDHLITLAEVFTALEKVNLAIKPSKCKLFKESIKYLGHIVDKNGCRPMPNSVDAIQKLARPTTIKGVRSFLGSLNFYRKFIVDFAEIAAPLYEFLKKKNATIIWNEKAEEAFLTLKSKLISAPLLAFPQFNKPFVIKTDASITSLGSVLEQENEKGELQPVAYASRRLNKAERNYAVIEREALAIVFALEHFKHLTFGNKIILLTDHKPLIYMNEAKDTHSRVARWMISIQKFDIQFEHIPGRLNSLADMLSRSHVEDEILTCALESKPRSLTIELLKEKQGNDDFCKDILNKIMNNEYRENEYILNENQIIEKKVQLGQTKYSAYRTLIPASLVPEVLFLYHDSIAGGHFSLDKTLYKVKRNFTWKTIFCDIRDYVRSCEKCQKRNRTRVKAPIQAVEPPTTCLSKLSIDVLGPFSLTQRRNKYVITYTDHFSRMTWASALPSQEAHIIANDYMKTIYTRYGGSKYILSDRGPQLVGHIMSNLCARLGIGRITTQAYHPRANGVSERINSKILKLISHYCNRDYTDWDIMLPYIMQAINNTVHRSTGQVPYYIFHGFHQYDAFSDFNLEEQAGHTERSDLVDEIMERLETAKAEVFNNLTNASINNARGKDRGRRLKEFDIGDSVLALDVPSYSGHNRKLKPRYTGPYTVIRRSGVTTYHIRDIKNPEVVKLMHVDKLKEYFPREYLDDISEESNASDDKRVEHDSMHPIVTFPEEDVGSENNDEQVRIIEDYLGKLNNSEKSNSHGYYLRSGEHGILDEEDVPKEIETENVVEVSHGYWLRSRK